MNEVDKMYENAGIEPEYVEGENLMEYSYGTLKYPPFTAEKQIELIKFLVENSWCNYLDWLVRCCESFEESLATLINNLWQDLTEEEKEQIKEVLDA